MVQRPFLPSCNAEPFIEPSRSPERLCPVGDIVRGQKRGTTPANTEGVDKVIRDFLTNSGAQIVRDTIPHNATEEIDAFLLEMVEEAREPIGWNPTIVICIGNINACRSA